MSPGGDPQLVLGASDLSVSLGGLPVLRGIELDVRVGEFVALVGSNGSGKSTLVKAMLGLLPLSRGEARLFGERLSAFRSWHRVGYVPQRSTLTMQSASVAEVVATGWLARRRPFVPAAASQRSAVREVLAQVGLAERAGAAMTTLSGGQQQRVLIARALVGQPDVLVMDEPLAGVDLESQWEMAEILRGFQQAGGTVLIVLHELGPLEPLIDRAIVLQDGRVVHDGPQQDLPGFGGHEHEHPDDQGWHVGPVWHPPHGGRHEEWSRR